jgi:hypothetical protein
MPDKWTFFRVSFLQAAKKAAPAAKEYTFKLLMVGEAGVGKSSLLLSFIVREISPLAFFTSSRTFFPRFRFFVFLIGVVVVSHPLARSSTE